MKVHTTHGLIEFDQLIVKDIVIMEENARVTATEWRLGEELVRRDVHVNILAPQAMNAAQGDI